MSKLEEVLASGRPVVTITIGDSMEPLLYNRSTRVVIYRTDCELKKNDLPVYKRPTGQFVMHRIIRVDKDYYYTRGDNRIGLEPVPKEWVLGGVTEIYRKDKHFSVDNKWYRSYVMLWNFIYPFRWIWMKVRSRIRRMNR